MKRIVLSEVGPCVNIDAVTRLCDGGIVTYKDNGVVHILVNVNDPSATGVKSHWAFKTFVFYSSGRYYSRAARESIENAIKDGKEVLVFDNIFDFHHWSA